MESTVVGGQEATGSACGVLAEAFAYPAPGRLAALESGLAALPEGAAKQAYGAFLKQVRRLSLGEWEELYTATLDLNPPAAPYVGYQTWGESYARGTFLAAMSRELDEAGVDRGGELPDHLAPVLRYLACTPHARRLPQLVEVLGPAVTRMLTVLRQSDPGNPYSYLLEAVQAVCQGLTREEP